MKNLLTTTTALIFAIALFAQEQAIEFTYDATGNRIERHVIVLAKDNPDNKVPNKGSEAEVFTEILGAQGISVFPNPTRGELTVEITNMGTVSTAMIEVFSLAGERVFQKNGLRNKTLVDLSKLPTGTYVLKIMLDSQLSSWKIIKE